MAFFRYKSKIISGNVNTYEVKGLLRILADTQNWLFNTFFVQSVHLQIYGHGPEDYCTSLEATTALAKLVL
jgi:hypothetical protein